MNSTASALDTSAENRAATPKHPSHRGSESISSAGRAASGLASPGMEDRGRRSEKRRNRREREQRDAGGGETAPDGALVPGPEQLLQDPR